MTNVSKPQRTRRVDGVGIVAVVLLLAGLTVAVAAILKGQYEAAHPGIGEKWAGLSVALVPLLASFIFAPLFLAGTIVAGIALRRPGRSRVLTGWAFGLGLPCTLYSLYLLAFALMLFGGSLFS
jgi:hypothetical protein